MTTLDTTAATRHRSWRGSSVRVQLAVLTGRSLRAMAAEPRLMILGMLQPLLMLLVLSEVFGSMANPALFPQGVAYVDYLMPAILLNTGLGAAQVAGMGLIKDMDNGVLARFRSLPITMFSVLFARSVADLGEERPLAAHPGDQLGQHVGEAAELVGEPVPVHRLGEPLVGPGAVGEPGLARGPRPVPAAGLAAHLRDAGERSPRLEHPGEVDRRDDPVGVGWAGRGTGEDGDRNALFHHATSIAGRACPRQTPVSTYPRARAGLAAFAAWSVRESDSLRVPFTDELPRGLSRG
ncbi:hypothetical protein GCM10022222_63760 [Amycolatopsis ultiminotia]|uniref:ABC-2 type transporter transmembrane domain-containing protein n=1 Tax=Amycolatopsis ultiminotia TaxID=543629 RepID=A0ABP6XQP5_9PSEU